MHLLPCSLERWLKSSGSLAPGPRFARESWALEEGKINAFGGPAGESPTGDWPPIVFLADLDQRCPKEAWLIFPCSHSNQIQIAALENDSKLELRLSKNARDLLQEILRGHHEPELDSIGGSIPIAVVRDPQGGPQSQSPTWIAWKCNDSRPAYSLRGSWELLASVLDRVGLPPNMILDDWQAQLERWKIAPPRTNLRELLPSISHRLLVSKSGLLVPLSEFELHPTRPVTDSLIEPSLDRNTGLLSAIPHRSGRANAKPKPHLSRLSVALLLSGAALGSVTATLLSVSSDTSQNDTALNGTVQKSPQPLDAPERPLEPHSPLDASFDAKVESGEDLTAELVRTDLSVDQAMSVDSIVRESLEINVSLASFATDEPQDPKREPKNAEELPAPASNELQLPEQQQADQGHNAPELVISRGQQSQEFRLGKTFPVKKAKGVFTLKLHEGLEDKLLVTGSMTQELVGPATGSWRIGMDDVDAELVLSIQSKPGLKWNVQTLVQIPSEAGGPMVPLNPGDPEAVLGRLGQYNSWLVQTADQWKISATGRTQPGRPTPAQMARLYSAKQKETEKAILRWRQIEQLAVSVFDAVSVQVELHPEPIAPDAPEHRPQ